MQRHVFFREPATRWVDFRPINGQLVLTHEKISFLCEEPGDSADWSIPLRLVEKVDYFKRLEMFRGNLALIGLDGEIQRFQVMDHKAWKERIQRTVRALF